jgi:hypothetical protein
LSDARALGIPDSVGIAAAADEHLTDLQVASGVAYAQGFRDVLGVDRTGAYGFAEFIDGVHNAGMASWWWKCGAAPTAAESTWATLWQRNSGQTTQTVNKVVVDVDDQLNSIGDDVALTADDIDAVATATLNKLMQAPITRQTNPGNPTRTGNTDLGAIIGYFDTSFDGVIVAATKPATVTLSDAQVSSLSDTVTAAVSKAVAGLSLSVSPSDQEAIATAVAAELGAKLTA